MSDKIENLSKIKSKIKRKRIKLPNVLNNYKNIETFEVLSNIPTSNDKTIQTNNSILDTSTESVGIEGFYIGTPKDPDDYEGEDELIDKSNDDDPRERLIQFVNYIYNKFDSINTYIARVAGKAIGREEPEYTDILIIKKYVCMFFSITISMFAVYNWIFITLYKDNHRYKHGINLIDISRERLTNAAFDENGSILFFIPLYFFEFSMFFPEKFQLYIVDYLPKITTRFVNATLSFFIMFYLLVYIFNNMGITLRDFFIKIINLDTNNFYIGWMYFIVIILFIASYFVFITAPIQAALKMATEQKFEFPRIPIYMYPIFIPFPIIGQMLSIILTLVIHTLRLVITCFLSVPIAGIFMAIYMLFYSFFGIVVYKFLNNDSNTFFETIHDINNFTNNSKHAIPAGTPCVPNTFFEMILITINTIIDFFHTYIFYIAYIIMLLYGLFDYYKNISRHHLKGGLLLTNIVIICMLFSFCIGSFIIKLRGLQLSRPDKIDSTQHILDELKDIYISSTDKPANAPTIFQKFLNYVLT